VELEPKQFWMARVKNFWMLEPEIWVLVPQTLFVGQASCTNKSNGFQFLVDQIVLELKPKTFRYWRWSQSKKI